MNGVGGDLECYIYVIDADDDQYSVGIVAGNSFWYPGEELRCLRKPTPVETETIRNRIEKAEAEEKE
jgi:hypothetical protein